ncbi:MAG: DUF2442 domain-containing protein [Melioribacteraceae bacterium]|nr:DUF2442 domain-containing protein [Melioribacteraceae bacterium]
MNKIVNVVATGNNRLFIKYDDGLEGELTFDHLMKRAGYEVLNNEEYFNSVTIDGKSGDLIWDNGISLCKNAAYKQLELKNLAYKLKLDLDAIE